MTPTSPPRQANDNKFETAKLICICLMRDMLYKYAVCLKKQRTLFLRNATLTGKLCIIEA